MDGACGSIVSSIGWVWSGAPPLPAANDSWTFYARFCAILRLFQYILEVGYQEYLVTSKIQENITKVTLLA